MSRSQVIGLSTWGGEESEKHCKDKTLIWFAQFFSSHVQPAPKHLEVEARELTPLPCCEDIMKFCNPRY